MLNRREMLTTSGVAIGTAALAPFLANKALAQGSGFNADWNSAMSTIATIYNQSTQPGWAFTSTSLKAFQNALTMAGLCIAEESGLEQEIAGQLSKGAAVWLDTQLQPILQAQLKSANMIVSAETLQSFFAPPSPEAIATVNSYGIVGTIYQLAATMGQLGSAAEIRSRRHPGRGPVEAEGTQYGCRIASNFVTSVSWVAGGLGFASFLGCVICVAPAAVLGAGALLGNIVLRFQKCVA